MSARHARWKGVAWRDCAAASTPYSSGAVYGRNASEKGRVDSDMRCMGTAPPTSSSFSGGAAGWFGSSLCTNARFCGDNACAAAVLD